MATLYFKDVSREVLECVKTVPYHKREDALNSKVRICVILSC